MKGLRDGRPFKILLTVSPVPLTATASGRHVLASTVYSKSILRSVAGQLSLSQKNIDYFPSYEIVTNPRMHSTAFADNLRSVRGEAVEAVMKHFFVEHPVLDVQTDQSKSRRRMQKSSSLEQAQCEEALLEAFSS